MYSIFASKVALHNIADNLYWLAFSGADMKEGLTGGGVGFLAFVLIPFSLEVFPVYYIYSQIEKVSSRVIFTGSPPDT